MTLATVSPSTAIPTPAQSQVLQDLRDAGCAIAIFYPEELRGADRGAIENRLVADGQDAIADLAVEEA